MKLFDNKRAMRLRLLIASEVPAKFRKDKNLTFHHGVGIVIANRARFLGRAHIWHNTTIGGKHGAYPTIGDNVFILPHSCIVGGITIGNNVVVGTGSVVVKPVPDNTIVAGNPAKPIRAISDEADLGQLIWGATPERLDGLHESE